MLLGAACASEEERVDDRPIVFLDSGDTLVDEGTEVHDAAGIVLEAALIPTAAEMVQGLLDRDVRLALVADGYTQSFVNVLGFHGLWDAFEVYAISDQVGASKPDPKMFETALDAMGVRSDRRRDVVMVGNNLGRDVRGANALGLTTVWLNWSPRRRKVPNDPIEVPHHEIALPIDLLSWLDARQDARQDTREDAR